MPPRGEEIEDSTTVVMQTQETTSNYTVREDPVVCFIMILALVVLKELSKFLK